MKSPDANTVRTPTGNWPIAAAVLLAAGLAGWCFCLWQDAPRAWRSLLINFAYFTPMAAGMVAWPAVVALARGRWAGGYGRWAVAAVAFAPVSLLAFVGMYIGQDAWAPWMREETPLHNGAWLNSKLLLLRDGGALLLMWIMAMVFARRFKGPGTSKILAAWFVVIYAAVFTLLGMDIVMSLDPHWPSSLFGWYYGISAMYAAIAGWTLACLLLDGRQMPANRRHDMGKLIVAFSLLTTYMMFSQLLVIWYSNLPEESRFVVPRLDLTPWRWVSTGLLAVIYLGPLVFLLGRRMKKSPAWLGAASVVVLCGMWFERWWLITPTLLGPRSPLTLGLAELSLAAAFAAALALAVGLTGRRIANFEEAPSP